MHQVIDLYGNNLTTVSFRRDMWSMRTLNLGGNPHLILPASVFNGTMPSLDGLLLPDSGLSQLDHDLLRSLPKVTTVSVRGGRLSSLPAAAFEYTPLLRTVDMGDNLLRSVNGSFARHHGLKWYKVALDGNLLDSAAMGEEFSGADHLDLSRNRIRSVSKEDFVSMEHVWNLNLSSNEIQDLETGSFSPILFLKSLDLSNNPIGGLNGSLQNSESLKEIFLSSASLGTLSADDLSGLGKVRHLHLSNNSLTTLRGALVGMPYLNSLDVSSNNLTTLPLDSFHPEKQTKFSLSLWMENNPWSCDCRLSWMVRWLKKHVHLKDEPTCASPASLTGRNISSLNLTELDRPDDGNCPYRCQCHCRSEGEVLGSLVDCSSRKLVHLPENFPATTWTVDFSFNGLEFFDGRGVMQLKQLRHLNLDNNYIKVVKNLKSLEHVLQAPCSIQLAGNELETFPLEDWGPRRTVSLAGNPWRCDCAAWDFAQWLRSHNASVVDLADVRCGPEEAETLKGRAIVSLSRADLCSADAGHFSSHWKIVLSTAGAVAAVLLFLACCVWRRAVAACCYYHGCSWLRRDSAHPEPVSYDAFLLHTDEEQGIAAEITRGLEEGKFHFIVCAPSRDVPSPRTHETVSAYMQQCSRILVLLSRNLLADQSQMSLLRDTLSFSLGFSTRTIVFVRCETLPSTQMDPITRILLKDCAVLRWGERFFWERLAYLLPKKRTRSNRRDDELIAVT